MQVKIDALEQMLEVENTVTTPLENFDLVVEPFDEAAGLAMNEIVGDFLPPGMKQFQEMIKTRQAAFLHLLDPTQYFGLGLFFGQVHVKDGS